MVPTFFPSYRIGVVTGRRKHPLPGPVAARVGVFTVKRIRQGGVAYLMVSTHAYTEFIFSMQEPTFFVEDWGRAGPAA